MSFVDELRSASKSVSDIEKEFQNELDNEIAHYYEEIKRMLRAEVSNTTYDNNTVARKAKCNLRLMNRYSGRYDIRSELDKLGFKTNILEYKNFHRSQATIYSDDKDSCSEAWFTDYGRRVVEGIIQLAKNDNINCSLYVEHVTKSFWRGDIVSKELVPITLDTKLKYPDWNDGLPVIVMCCIVYF